MNIIEALKIMKFTVKINNISLNVSGIYRCFHLKKPNFNNLIENDNHFIIGDFKEVYPLKKIMKE